MPRRTEPSASTATFGEHLRELRLARNMSLGDLANAAGLSTSHLSSIEHGLAAIRTETVERIAVGLGIPPLYIFAFPKDDERTRIADLILDFPASELTRLRKELEARRKAMRK